MARKLNPAEVVVEEFGVRPLARHLSIDPTTVVRWKQVGLVPSSYHRRLIQLAKRLSKTITPEDLVNGR